MPVHWDELPHLAGAAQWTIANAVDRLRTQRSDPWAGYWKARQRLGPAMRTLGWRPGANV